MQLIPFLATNYLAETRVMALSFIQNTRYWMNYQKYIDNAIIKCFYFI